MRRRGGGGFIGFFIFMFILMSVSDVLEMFGPLLFMGLFFGSIFFIIKAIIDGKNANNKGPIRVDPTIRKNINGNRVQNVGDPTSRLSKLSNADLNKIDKKLENYFKTNMSLPIIEGIALTTQSGKFTTADQLYLTYKDEKILKLGEFKNNYFPIYDKIMQLLLVFSKRKDDILSTEVDMTVKKENIMSDAEKYIDKIDSLNRAIPQEEITNGLYQTCDLIKQIELLKESKSDQDKVQKLHDYYLPILIDVLEKYKKLQDSPNHGDEFKKSEAQLIKTIVLINEALKTISESMQEDDYMNINADISTLQSLLQKDGYGENPFSGD